MLTDSNIKKNIEIFARTISNQSLGLVSYSPEQWAKPSMCFENVISKLEKDGGRVQFGWMFHHRVVARMSGQGYLIAVHHAVWYADDGHLIVLVPI